jgi:transposase-like protein
MADRRKFSKEFKENALELARRGDKSIKEIAESLGITAERLYRWRARAAEAAGTRAFPGQGNPRDEELARLRKENAMLKETNEILKKAAAILWIKDPQ